MSKGDVIAGKKKRRKVRKEFIFIVNNSNCFYLFYWKFLF